MTPIEKAKKYGIDEPGVNLLLCVGGWFNGFTFEVENRNVSIGRAYEPSLRQLTVDQGVWFDQSPNAHEAMVRSGLFKSDERNEDCYIAGRRCDWLPTQNCLTIIEDIFSESEGLYAPWATESHSGPPTFRDGVELMEHRKGVMATRRAVDPLERVTSLETYPQVDLPERPDLRIFGQPPGPMARVEVLSDHNNRDSWENKFTAWSAPKAGPTIWIFKNRRGMVQFWNHLVRHGIIQLDGGMFGGRATNWSPTRINDRLQRSREGTPDYSSHDIVWTIPGVIEADTVDVFEWLSKYNIIK